MPTDTALAELRGWVHAKAGDPGITDRTPLFAERHLRSVQLPELLLLLERLRGARIDVERLEPGDFHSIATIADRFLPEEE